ncbi:hypothetical protein Taro_009416, partial [Colocasia esculenta]|nr:hypothetical protein [Colocasia esculenta]
MGAGRVDLALEGGFRHRRHSSHGRRRTMARGEQSQGLDDPGWVHLTLVDAKKRKVKYNYRGKDIHGGITRGKQHLAGVRGEVKQYDIAPRKVREVLFGPERGRQRRAENEAEISQEFSGRMSRRATRDDDDELDSEDSDPELIE